MASMIILWLMPGGCTGGIEQVDRQVRHDHDVAVRVDLDRHGPHHLVEVEGVDVLVDDDDDAWRTRDRAVVVSSRIPTALAKPP